MIPRLGGVSAPWTTYDSYSRNAFGRLGNEGLERSSRTDGRGPQDGSDTAQNVMERASIRHSTTPERSPRSCSQKAVREHDFLHWIGSDWDTAASSPTYSSPSPSSSSSLRLPSPWSTPRGLLGFILDPWDLQSSGLLGYISSSWGLMGPIVLFGSSSPGPPQILLRSFSERPPPIIIRRSSFHLPFHLFPLVTALPAFFDGIHEA